MKFSDFEGLTKNGKRKVDCWSSKNKDKPINISKASGKKFIFDCDVCNHEFESILYSINKGTWCPYCVNQKICNDNNCNICFEKSFASFEGLTKNNIKKIDCWSNKNKKNPRNILKSSNKKFIFDCDVCNHEFESRLTKINIGQWCPYCSIPCKKLCNGNNCNICFEKCVAGFEGLTKNNKKKGDCWSSKNKENPRNILKCSNKKFIFNCDVCNHEF